MSQGVINECCIASIQCHLAWPSLAPHAVSAPPYPPCSCYLIMTLLFRCLVDAQLEHRELLICSCLPQADKGHTRAVIQMAVECCKGALPPFQLDPCFYLHPMPAGSSGLWRLYLVQELCHASLQVSAGLMHRSESTRMSDSDQPVPWRV